MFLHSTLFYNIEMEYFVDVKHCASFVLDFQEYQASVRNQSQCAGQVPKTGQCSLFTGVRYGKADEISWMSQMYKRDICVISNIVLGTSEISGPPKEFALFGKHLEKIATEKYQGRPHWGKMNWANASVLKPVYGKFDAFNVIRKEVDPKGMFLNDYLRRVLGVQ